MRIAALFRRIHQAREESGQVLVLFAFGLVAFLALVGLSVDVGQIVTTRTDMQKVADAAALAGAQDLPESVADAETSALQYAALNASGIDVEVSFDGTESITVEARKRVDFAFLRVLGIDGSTPGASATAFASQEVVTGYYLHSTAPFVIWGGSREDDDFDAGSCPTLVCVGHSYAFLGNQWMAESGNPNAPDWTANDSNNFNGVINHGSGNPVVHVGDAITVSSPGGLGSVVAPSPGTTLIIPVVEKASGNSDNRTFTIAAWVEVTVDNGCNKQRCYGTVKGPATAPEGAVTGGSVEPPPELHQLMTEPRLVN